MRELEVRIPLSSILSQVFYGQWSGNIRIDCSQTPSTSAHFHFLLNLGIMFIVDMGGFGHLRDFCNFWTRELHLNSSYGLGFLRQPFRTMSCRKFGSKINVGMSGIFLKFVIFLASKKFLG